MASSASLRLIPPANQLPGLVTSTAPLTTSGPATATTTVVTSGSARHPGSAGTIQPVTVRVVVAEDSLLVREGICRLLDASDGVELVDAVGDLESLLGAVEEHQPSVVLTDIRMPPTGTDEGIRAALLLREKHPQIGVVVLSQYAEPAYALQLLEGGSECRAYLLK
ncbi:hypothetical protein BH10ACT3_BH10ACT3_13750 [soil metagenome]